MVACATAARTWRRPRGRAAGEGTAGNFPLATTGNFAVWQLF